MTYFRIHYENALKEIELLKTHSERKIEQLERAVATLQQEQLNLIAIIEKDNAPAWVDQIKQRASSKEKVGQ